MAVTDIRSCKLRINYLRNGLIEESHEGYFIRNDDEFCKITLYPYYLRSCAKPLQASLIIDCGIEMIPEELALCCGSHSGEDIHIKTGRNILKKIGLDETYLKCPLHPPLSRKMQDKMLISCEKPLPIHNNCSGKHIGFLAICKHNGWDLGSYDSPEHPLQIAIKQKIYEMCGVTEEYPMTTDGCGVPIVSMPLKNIADGYIKLLKYPQILNAIRNNPYIFGGENRLDTEIVTKSENLIAKVGAGGLCVVLNPAEQKSFVVKINDCSMEARRIAVLECINKLGWANIEFDKSISTQTGKKVGEIEVVFSY